MFLWEKALFKKNTLSAKNITNETLAQHTFSKYKIKKKLEKGVVVEHFLRCPLTSTKIYRVNFLYIHTFTYILTSD